MKIGSSSEPPVFFTSTPPLLVSSTENLLAISCTPSGRVCVGSGAGSYSSFITRSLTTPLMLSSMEITRKEPSGYISTNAGSIVETASSYTRAMYLSEISLNARPFQTGQRHLFTLEIACIFINVTRSKHCRCVQRYPRTGISIKPIEYGHFTDNLILLLSISLFTFQNFDLAKSRPRLNSKDYESLINFYTRYSGLRFWTRNNPAAY